MAKIKAEELEKMAAHKPAPSNWIKVGMSSCGIAAGAEEIYSIFQQEIKKRNLQIEVKKCGCVGVCYAEPIVEIKVSGLPQVTYGKVNRETALEIVEKHLCGNTLVDDHIFELGITAIAQK